MKTTAAVIVRSGIFRPFCVARIRRIRRLAYFLFRLAAPPGGPAAWRLGLAIF